MKPVLAILLLAVASSAFSCGRNSTAATSAARTGGTLTEDEKHRLYSAALAASDSPLDSDVFKDACRKIEIFDNDGKPNEKYMTFVTAHVDWSMRPQGGEFRHEINTKEKARAYLDSHL